MRRLFALAVVVLHGLLLLLLVAGQRLRPDPARNAPAFVSVWITLPPVLVKGPETPVTPAVARLPRIARSEETSGPDEIEPAEAQPPSTEAAITPRVDWVGEAARAARRAAAESEKREGFSDPPKALRKPCEFRKPSMEWNGREDRRVGMDGIFPYVRLGNCVVSLGFFSCTGSSAPNTHILDDMKDRDRPRTSVPDTELCE